MVVCLVATAVTGATTTTTTKHRHHSSHSTRSSHPHAGRRNLPAAPTPERYQQIQQALASRGYFQGEANGTWNSDSVDALKRFQADQNLPPDGKLTSLSLIAMGLGPKRTPAPTSTPPATSAAPATVPSNPPPAPPAPAAAH